MCRTLLSSSRRASWPTTQTAHERALPLEEGLVRPTELMSRCRIRSRAATTCRLLWPATADDGGKLGSQGSGRTPPHTLRLCVLTTKTATQYARVAVVPRRLTCQTASEEKCYVVVVFSSLLPSWRWREGLLAELIKLLERLVETTLVIVIPVPASLADAWDVCEPKPMSLVEGLQFPRDS